MTTTLLRVGRVFTALLVITAAALVGTAASQERAGATPPGANGRIAFFQGTSEVNTILPNGTGQTDVTPTGYAMFPGYLADGSLSYMELSGRMIVKVAPDGTKTNLFVRPSGGFGAQPSPDGTTFALGMAETGTFKSTITLVNSDGTNSRQPWAGDSWNETGFNWFPGSQRVVYMRSDDMFMVNDIYISKPDGTNATKVNLTLAEGYSTLSNPSVSSDGKKLVFSVYNTLASRIDLATANIDGTNVKYIATQVGASNAQFSPDGTQIVFEGFDAQGLWLMNANGTNQHKLTNSPNTHPVWQPLPVNKKPVPVITMQKLVQYPQTIVVSAKGSTDPDGTIASYQWYWGDQTTPGTGLQTWHSFGKKGTYIVYLVVTDNKGATGVAAKQITI